MDETKVLLKEQFDFIISIINDSTEHTITAKKAAKLRLKAIEYFTLLVRRYFILKWEDY